MSNQTVFVDSFNLTGTQNIAFGHASPVDGWPIGNYKISLALNAKEFSTAKFRISSFIVSTPGRGLAVELNTPVNEATDLPATNCTFCWQTWRGVTKYKFNLAEDSEFKNIILSTIVLGNETQDIIVYNCPEKLKYETTYYWHVRPLDFPGPTNWSAPLSFKTEQSPALAPVHKNN